MLEKGMEQDGRYMYDHHLACKSKGTMLVKVPSIPTWDFPQTQILLYIKNDGYLYLQPMKVKDFLKSRLYHRQLQE